MNRRSTKSQQPVARDSAAPAASRLKRILDGGRFALTAEITPPVSSDLGELLSKAAPLKGLADAVNVTDGAGARAHLDSTIAANALLKEGIEPILQLTCRDRNRIALQSQLLGAAALGKFTVGGLPDARGAAGHYDYFVREVHVRPARPGTHPPPSSDSPPARPAADTPSSNNRRSRSSE